MNNKAFKNVILILFLAFISFVLFIEFRNSIRKIKGETEYKGFTETNEYEPQIKKETSTGFWRPIERRDSFNNELQFYSKNNVAIEGDSIEIISKKEEMEDKKYTSGQVESNYAYKYGYFEFTIEISEGKGIFPAIWFLPINELPLPEIDLFEMIGSEPHSFYGVVHFEKDGARDSDYFVHEVPPKDQYSVALKWTKEALTWYIDHQEIYSTTQGVPQDFMYILINQAIGGDWPGKPDDSIFPNKFKILSMHIEPEFEKGRE